VSSDRIMDDGYHPYHKRRLAEGHMKIGDIVNYTGQPFDGPSIGGLILDSRARALDVDDPRSKKNVSAHQVYWASHDTTNWVLETKLEVSA